MDLEPRSRDCAANHICFCTLSEAGLDGIRKQQKALKELTEEDIRRLS